ncbi:MAG: family 10 glycosylhydrolase [Desulfobulbaceae bacterium]|nr:family 10 glycosylhydrolase [Desulfobulbaceae bacterium]
MNRFSHISLGLVLLAFLTCRTCCFASSSPELTAWVVRWHMDTPKKIQSICKEANGRFQDLLVQVRGRADAYYKSDLAPRAEELDTSPAAFDPLASVLKECRGQNIQAWMNVYYLWTGDQLPQNSSHPAQPDNPWMIKDNSGRKVSDYTELEQAQNWIEGIYADPASIEYRKLFADVVKEIAFRYPVEGIHLDFVRYPNAHFGFATELAVQYEKKWGIDPRFLPEKITPEDLRNWYSGSMNTTDQLLVTGALIWAEMRAQAVTDLVRQVKQTLGHVNKNQTLSAAVFPDYLPAYLDKGQDWLTWAEEGLIDALYPMAYFGEQQRVTRQINDVVSATRNLNTPIIAGLGAYIKKPEEIGSEVASLDLPSLRGISLFSLGHIMRKKGGVLPYVQAVSNSSDNKMKKAVHGILGMHQDNDVLQMIKEFKILLANEDSIKKGHSSVIAERLSHFSKAGKNLFPETINRLAIGKSHVADWLEMYGIFRYVHPYDTEEKKTEQQKLCNEARLKMLAGANMGKVSKKYSQAGSRRFQSRLPRYYLTKDRKKDQQLAKLNTGEVSPVFEEENGYWSYKIIDRGQEKTALFSELSWPARRVLFREKVARILSAANQL